MTYIVLIVAAFAVVHLYAAALAIGCVLRDVTLAGVPRVLRLIGVLVIPFVASLLVLRSTAEFAPESLPSGRWLRPLMPILHVRVIPSTELGADTFKRAEEMQPGQSVCLDDHNSSAPGR